MTRRIGFLRTAGLSKFLGHLGTMADRLAIFTKSWLWNTAIARWNHGATARPNDEGSGIIRQRMPPVQDVKAADIPNLLTLRLRNRAGAVRSRRVDCSREAVGRAGNLGMARHFAVTRTPPRDKSADWGRRRQAGRPIAHLSFTGL